MNTMMDMMNRYEQIDIVCTTADSMAQGAQRAIDNVAQRSRLSASTAPSRLLS